MADVYASLVAKGIKKLNDVPQALRGAVIEALAKLGIQAEGNE